MNVDSRWQGKITFDLHQFVDTFFNSDFYREGDPFDQAISGWEPYLAQVRQRMAQSGGPEVSVEEIRNHYHNSIHVRLLMYRFALRQLMIGFDESRYQAWPQLLKAYTTYRDIVIASKTAHTRQEILDLDQQRTAQHQTVGQALEQTGLTPTGQLGRVVARLWLVYEGIEEPAAFEQSEIARYGRHLY